MPFRSRKYFKGHEDVVVELINGGADVNLIGGAGTPLYDAVSNGREKIVKILLDNGADINKWNCAEDTLRNIAAKKGFKKIVAILDAKQKQLDNEAI